MLWKCRPKRMGNSDFLFEEWKCQLQNERKQYTAEMSTDILKGNTLYSYYHDLFSDNILEMPHESTGKYNDDDYTLEPRN